jgi:hypothetical protein
VCLGPRTCTRSVSLCPERLCRSSTFCLTAECADELATPLHLYLLSGRLHRADSFASAPLGASSVTSCLRAQLPIKLAITSLETECMHAIGIPILPRAAAVHAKSEPFPAEARHSDIKLSTLTQMPDDIAPSRSSSLNCSAHANHRVAHPEPQAAGCEETELQSGRSDSTTRLCPRHYP